MLPLHYSLWVLFPLNTFTDMFNKMICASHACCLHACSKMYTQLLLLYLAQEN